MSRIRVSCMIHEGSIGTTKIKQLESVLASTYQAHFGTDKKLVFLWLTIPHGQAYIAGKLSTASTVSIPVADGLPADKRHPFMSEVCAKWQHITNCSKNEIILVSSDMAESTKFQEKLMSRVAESARVKTQAKMLLSMGKGYFSKGYLNTSINL